MGAIFGQWRFDGSAPPRSELDRMAESMRGRAPDGVRYLDAGPVALGHGALCLYREDRFDRQPVCGDDAGLMLVADGRLDNREVLAEELGIDSASLAETADSAIILAAYRRWGAQCVPRLLGDFAFALWDAERSELLLARDHSGQATLYYWRDDRRIAFASDARALFALPFVPRVIDEREMAIQGARAGHPPSHGRTLFEDVHGVVGGRYLILRADGSLREEEYWRPGAAPEHVGRDEAYYVATYRRLVAEAVACRVRRLIDPPGLLLSGGFDSSAIAGLAGLALPPDQKMLTITSTVPRGREVAYDARPSAEACVAHMPHIDHEWYVAETGPMSDDAFVGLMQPNNEPLIPGVDVLPGMLARLRARGARLVMNGHGGDGSVNPRGANVLAELVKAGQAGRALSEARHRARTTRRPWWHVIWGHLFVPLIPHAWRLRWATRHKSYSPYSNTYLRTEKQEALLAEGVIEPFTPVPYHQRRNSLEDRLSLFDFLRHRTEPVFGAEATQNGLVQTRPMMDKRLIEFGLAIPLELQVVRGQDRYLARRALGDVLPPSFRTRPSGHESLAPLMHESLRAALPHIRAEVERMRENTVLQEWFDLDRMATELSGEPEDVFPEGRQSYLLVAYACARFIASVKRLNY